MAARALSDDELIAELLREAEEEEKAEKAWRAAHPVDFTLHVKSQTRMVVPFSASGSWRLEEASSDSKYEHTL